MPTCIAQYTSPIGTLEIAATDQQLLSILFLDTQKRPGPGQPPTISYLELARRLGDEKCIRAAGMANGRNPISILVPCHRVIGSNGQLVGYGAPLLLQLPDRANIVLGDQWKIHKIDNDLINKLQFGRQ